MLETFISQVEWMTVTISTLVCFVLGWLWYSDKLFGKQWKAGLGTPAWTAPMWMPMSAQLGSTFLLAIIINMATADGHAFHAILVAITVAGFIKANGYFSGKTMTAVSVDVLYVVVMAAIMITINLSI